MTNKQLIFFGDSYVADYKSAPPHLYGPRPKKFPQGHYNSYIDTVIETTALPYKIFSRGGSSWWWQRGRIFEYFDQNPQEIDNIHTMIMFHTASARFNSSSNDIWPLDNIYNPEDVSTALKYYYVHLYDQSFHSWAHAMFIKEIKEKFANTRIINFLCFDTEKHFLTELPGMTCSFPITPISLSEFDYKGDIDRAQKQVLVKDKMEKRLNHMNQHNNNALSKVILWAIENYREGLFDLDLSAFDIKDFSIIDQYKTIMGTT